MREIKFRAWDTVNKIWCYSFDMSFIGDGDCLFRENLIPVQYTGLHDKNGKEIYEGDIVSWLHRSEMGEGDNQDSMTVKWEEGEDDWGRYRMEGFRIPYVECEVIGNIYENPELLNVTPKND